MEKQPTKHPYKYTLSAVFLGIFSIALTLLMLLYFVVLTTRTRSEHRELVLSDTSSRFEILNTELLTAFHAFSNVQRSSALQILAESASMRDVYYNAIAAQQQLAESTLAASRLNYYSIAAVYLEHGRDLVVTPTETLSLDFFAQQIGTTADALRASYDQLKERSYGYNQLYSCGQDTAGKINYLTLQNYSDGSLLFVLTIDQENFSEILDALKCSDWMIFSQDTLLAAKGSDPEHYSAMMKRIHTHEPVLSNSLVSLDFSLDGQNVLGAAFSEIGWQFYATYPTGTMGLTRIVTLFLLPLLFLAAGSVLLAKLLYTRLYAPVEELVTWFGGDTVEGSNEFDYIREQTSQISEKAKELDLYLQHSQLMLTEQVYKNALLDANFNYDEEPQELEKQSFVVVQAEMAEELAAADAFAMAKNLLRDTVRTRADQHFVGIGDSGFALVLNCDDTEEARQKVQGLLTELGISARMQLRVALSSPALGLKNLHMLMEQCNHLLEYRYKLPDQMFLTAEDVAQIYYNGYYYPMKVEVSLVQMTVSGTEGALALLEQILYENLVEKLLSPESKSNFIFALVSTLNRIYQELQLEESDQYPAISELLSCKDTDLLLQKIRTTFARIVWNTSKRNDSLTQDVGERMTAYIRANYAQDISLDDMAEKLNLSPKYCSALFKKQTGQTFKKALNEYRIERAKELLQQEPDKKINDLAMEVGFVSANTFIQVFKQYMGTTPRQYSVSQRS